MQWAINCYFSMIMKNKNYGNCLKLARSMNCYCLHLALVKANDHLQNVQRILGLAVFDEHTKYFVKKEDFLWFMTIKETAVLSRKFLINSFYTC